MIELEKESTKPVYAIIVGRTEDRNLSDENVVHEMASLADTAGLVVAGSIVLRRFDPSPKFGMGSGKAEEIAAYAKECDAEQIVFDFEITPTQQRNWEELTKITCVDRQEIIIRIFGNRAITREAVLQVELAKLEYSLPRLAHTYEALSRQRGGRYGTKGSGETQLELDKRAVMNKIALMKKELVTIRTDRANRRKRRELSAAPSCAIVGYTNVGKSSLLNALTGAGVLSEDKLFATLDPTTRRYNLPTGMAIMLTDTVGFIKNLPHSLVDAFHATLEEASLADAVLIVLDASDSEIAVQHKTTLEVLSEVGASTQPSLLILNKIDRLDEDSRAKLRLEYPDAIMISSKTQEGFSDLTQHLDALLSGKEHLYRLPASRGDLVAFAHREGSVLDVQYEDSVILLRARTSGRLEAALSEYEWNE